jgi:hypothetical protein
MDYVVALRTAQNDVKAVINLEPARKARVAPLMHVRGKDDKQVVAFLDGWGDFPYFLEISRFAPDVDDALIVNGGLHSPLNAYQAKRQFFDWARKKNGTIIPVVSWAPGDPAREIVQCAVLLENTYERVAVQIDMNAAQSEIDKVTRILDAVSTPQNLIILLNMAQKSPPDLAITAPLSLLIGQLRSYGISRYVLLSTSFPDEKPPSGTVKIAPCLDLLWQKTIKTMIKDVEFIYGDYGATNPTSALEYIPGMAVIPFANYLIKTEWTQIRQGKDKEFFIYQQIAAAIQLLPGYHGDDFCWATREIGRIAKGVDNKNGNNGTWNGYKINQHICEALNYLGSPGASAQPAYQDDDL